jgi:hypothetical protein
VKVSETQWRIEMAKAGWRKAKAKRSIVIVAIM